MTAGEDDTPKRRRRARDAPLRIERVQPSYVQVASQLRALILAGQTRPGERLPPEADLSARFGVSRSTTREALRLLAAEHLVETRRGVTGGTFVTHPDPHDIEISLSTAINLAASAGTFTRDHVFEVWRLVYPTAARLAALRRSDEQAAVITRLAAPAGPNEGDAQLTLRSIDFHRAVIDAVGNPLLQILSLPLTGFGAASIHGTAGAHQFLSDVQLRHGAIAQAIVDGDAERAYELMLDDMAAPEHHHATAAERPTTAEPSPVPPRAPRAASGARARTASKATKATKATKGTGASRATRATGRGSTPRSGRGR